MTSNIDHYKKDLEALIKRRSSMSRSHTKLTHNTRTL